MSVMTGEGGRGAELNAGVPVADFVAGLYGAYSVVAAVHPGCSYRKRKLHRLLDVSECPRDISAADESEYYGNGLPTLSDWAARIHATPYQGYRGSGKPFVITAGRRGNYGAKSCWLRWSNVS